MTDLEKVLTGLAIAEAIALIIVWIKSHANRNSVLLEPGKDRLQVVYWWIDATLINDDAEENFRNLYKTENEEEITYRYDVEDIKTLVSKNGSNIVSTKMGAIRPPSKKPPPLNAVLMAIEITVLERSE